MAKKNLISFRRHRTTGSYFPYNICNSPLLSSLLATPAPTCAIKKTINVWTSQSMRLCFSFTAHVYIPFASAVPRQPQSHRALQFTAAFKFKQNEAQIPLLPSVADLLNHKSYTYQYNNICTMSRSICCPAFCTSNWTDSHTNKIVKPCSRLSTVRG